MSLTAIIFLLVILLFGFGSTGQVTAKTKVVRRSVSSASSAVWKFLEIL